MPRLAIYGYFSQFKSDFDGKESKIGLLSWYNLISYLSTHQQIFQLAIHQLAIILLFQLYISHLNFYEAKKKVGLLSKYMLTG